MKGKAKNVPIIIPIVDDKAITKPNFSISLIVMPSSLVRINKLLIQNPSVKANKIIVTKIMYKECNVELSTNASTIKRTNRKNLNKIVYIIVASFNLYNFENNLPKVLAKQNTVTIMTDI